MVMGLTDKDMEAVGLAILSPQPMPQHRFRPYLNDEDWDALPEDIKAAYRSNYQRLNFGKLD